MRTVNQTIDGLVYRPTSTRAVHRTVFAARLLASVPRPPLSPSARIIPGKLKTASQHLLVLLVRRPRREQ